MNAQAEPLDRMLAIWNERDLAQVPALLAEVLSADVEFIDPTIVTRGLAEFEANVRHFRGKYPDAVIRRTSVIDSHHNLHRYTWDITVAGAPFLAGFDVSETDASGKVKRVLGFFGPLTERPA